MIYGSPFATPQCKVMSSKKPNVWARRKARRALVQAVYQWQLTQHSFSQLVKDFQTNDSLKKADVEYFEEQLRKVVFDTETIDASFESLLDRPSDQLDVVERGVLRLATAEFLHRPEIPYRVVIDEYVELTKVFGSQDAYKYINGVLDKLAATLRAIEVEALNRS